jgi:acyl carrier protein phosphodiesterase
MPGVFLGDHVKGKLSGNPDDVIEQGIRFHRAVDVFVDSSPMQQRSIARFDRKYRRFGGIICDIIYDFHLANHWDKFSDAELPEFCRDAYVAVLDQGDRLGPDAHAIAQRMQAHQSLESYGSRAYVERALNHLSQRLTRRNPLAEAVVLLDQLETELGEDFLQFMPGTMAFADQWLAANQLNAAPQKY